MKAIIETGGKQYYVSVGDTIFVEKLDAEEGKKLTIFTYVPNKRSTRKKQGHRQPYTKIEITNIK